MKVKRFLVATCLLFVVALGWNALVHLALLRGAEAQMKGIFRSDAAQNWWLGLLLAFTLVSLFVVGYHQFARSISLSEAIGFGLYFGVLAVLLVDVNQYLLYPVPGRLALAWSIFGVLEFVVYGVVLRWLYARSGWKTKNSAGA
jgi:hypothetical protein